MDKLEKIIRDLRDDIQNDMPTEGHFERFELKLASVKKKQPNYWIGFLSGIAAVLVIALFIFFNPLKQNKQSLTLSDLSDNYADVEFYYTSSIKTKTQKLTELCEKAGNDDQTIHMLYAEMEEYDKTYSQICAELNAAPNDERVINALITYYQTKLEIINKIFSEIENKQKQIESHENTNI